jgi:hypothetical protein
VRTITITLDFGPAVWEKTYNDGEIGEGTNYTIDEWFLLSEDERMLNAMAWCGVGLRSLVSADNGPLTAEEES